MNKLRKKKKLRKLKFKIVPGSTVEQVTQIVNDFKKFDEDLHDMEIDSLKIPGWRRRVALITLKEGSVEELEKSLEARGFEVLAKA